MNERDFRIAIANLFENKIIIGQCPYCNGIHIHLIGLKVMKFVVAPCRNLINFKFYKIIIK